MVINIFKEKVLGIILGKILDFYHVIKLFVYFPYPLTEF